MLVFLRNLSSKQKLINTNMTFKHEFGIAF